MSKRKYSLTQEEKMAKIEDISLRSNEICVNNNNRNLVRLASRFRFQCVYVIQKHHVIRSVMRSMDVRVLSTCKALIIEI